MLDRSISPPYGQIESVHLPEPKVYHLSNGLPVFVVNLGKQDLVKVELVFNCGTATAQKKLVGSTTIRMLREGTGKMSSEEIANTVDFYGAYLEHDVGYDECSVSLFTLTKHLSDTLPILFDVYNDPSFPEREFETLLRKNKQELLIKQQKVGYTASKTFNSVLFGKDHPYGRSANSEDYEQLTRSDLVNHHKLFIKDRLSYIIMSGKIEADAINHLEFSFGKLNKQLVNKNSVTGSDTNERVIHIDKSDAVQNAIRVGRVLFNRTHPDFMGVQILATVLGGYFGSRLMRNIREDKGYTYGIGASVVSLRHSGYLSISTEVGSDVCQSAIDEIYLEIGRLRKDLIPTAELELVRSYLLGSILKSTDGPFNVAAKWKSYLGYGVGIDAHHDFIHLVKTITSERLRELAKTYLQSKDLIQVTVGKTLN